MRRLFLLEIIFHEVLVDDNSSREFACVSLAYDECLRTEIEIEVHFRGTVSNSGRPYGEAAMGLENSSPTCRKTYNYVDSLRLHNTFHWKIPHPSISSDQVGLEN
jgi:hypothetical protein